jgi:hypothetical protein
MFRERGGQLPFPSTCYAAGLAETEQAWLGAIRVVGVKGTIAFWRVRDRARTVITPCG